MKTLKEVNKELMKELKKHYRSGRMVYYTPEHSHVIIKPFKSSNMEFGIFLSWDSEASCIMRSPNFETAEDGDNDRKIYMLSNCGSLKDGFNFEVIMSRLKDIIKEYVREEKDFYKEGLEIHRKWSKDEKEAKELAGIIYEKGYLKELGIEE